MPTLVLKNVPADLLERLSARAAANRRGVDEETLAVLDEALHARAGATPAAPPAAATADWRRLVGKWSDGDESAGLAAEIQRRRTRGRKVDL
ncbi:MAG: hypothetical protein IPK07_17745 [Deltaproteobacteria bacterium]|nr:hypothetical protein [Deltaproteobacteria bacterium]